MRDVAVHGGNDQGNETRPDEAARKRVAVELIRDHDRPLRWTARRFSLCEADAEDAYQRGVEILLSKAPTTDLRHLLPWTRKVIKHEALAIRKTRERTLARPAPAEPGGQADDWIELIPAGEDGPDELTIRRERVARSREALSLLKPAELKALTQLAEGFSYREIGAMNEWTRTKVNRCLAEGRARFRDAFHDSETGERCPQFEPLLSACCDGELDRGQIHDLEKHLAACGHCRSTLRAYRAAPRAAAALAPLLPADRGLWERAQELFVDLQMRVQGLGRGADSGVQTVIASGGTRGAGVAAMAKLAAICAGTAGTAAVCAATGVLPAPELLPARNAEPAAERPAVTAEPDPRPEPIGLGEDRPVRSPEPERPVVSEKKPVTAEPPKPAIEPPPAPPPTPTETEFTPEASGTAVQAAPPPPKPASNPVPVTNGGGEFAP